MGSDFDRFSAALTADELMHTLWELLTVLLSPGHLGALGDGHSQGASVLDVAGIARVQWGPVEVCLISDQQPSASPARGVWPVLSELLGSTRGLVCASMSREWGPACVPVTGGLDGAETACPRARGAASVTELHPARRGHPCCDGLRIASPIRALSNPDDVQQTRCVSTEKPCALNYHSNWRGLCWEQN